LQQLSWFLLIVKKHRRYHIFEAKQLRIVFFIGANSNVAGNEIRDWNIYRYNKAIWECQKRTIRKVAATKLVIVVH
jgi:hypothetical protein